MTRAVGDRILKDMDGNISDHLRNHIHLTNCIHLKNHMHKYSPILADRALMRDLVVLQRSRSLRDPSASPPSWHSPSVACALLKRAERDALVNGRRSVGLERRRESERMSGSSPSHLLISQPATGEVSRHNDEAAAAGASGLSSKSGIRECRRVQREEASGRYLGNDVMGWNNNHPQDGNDSGHDSVSGNFELRDKDIKQREKVAQEAGSNIRSHASSLNRIKKRRFHGARRNRPVAPTPGVESQNEMSVASNSYAQGRALQKYHMGEGDQEYFDQNVKGVPRNGCGIPWNWSRIHHRGKSFIDMAGRSLSCGLSDTRLKKDGSICRGRDMCDMPVMSDYSSSSPKSNAETLPLLLDASGSQGSKDNAAWVHDYSGELGIFADNLLNQEIDSDLASEGRSDERPKFRRNQRHQNLAQKYMPRTFRDLVGQKLVAQALSNAVVKKKVGLLYVLYGPHGTGKTSCARIFARALNCQSLEHPKPCGFCKSCIAHDIGKSRSIREIGPVSNFDSESIMDLLDSMITSPPPSQYRVFIFDECDNLSPDCWSAILKIIDRAPRRVVFALVCSSLDVLPHIIISRCQKFFFPKLKDADIIYTLQWIATKEDLEIDKDALKLIASRSDGSLRDAEMTLEQLSLLGQRISVSLVQELVGLISNEKLVDLLDLALSADTVNTVKNLREIMESGVEPLALMSQLATLITDILAGSYDFMKERTRRKFFQQQALSKGDMEKLRQALKTLSETEKQLRMSNDRITWLTAAVLQLAPDQHYMLPGPSADNSFNHSPLGLNNATLREKPRKSNVEKTEVPIFQAGNCGDAYYNTEENGVGIDRRGYFGGGMVSQQGYVASNNKSKRNSVQLPGKYHQEIEEVWVEVLGKIPINSIKEFMRLEGKLISVSYGAAPTVQLMFSSQLTKSKAEKFRRLKQSRDSSSARNGGSEIVEIEASPRETKDSKSRDYRTDFGRQNGKNALVITVTPSQKTSSTTAFLVRQKLGDKNQSLSLVRSKVSLAHVIQQAEGCSQQSRWSKRKAVSIAEKLEQENMRLEPRSRRLLCWNPPTVTRRKFSRLKIRTRKPQALLKFVCCGRCLSAKSPRYSVTLVEGLTVDTTVENVFFSCLVPFSIYSSTKNFISA
ncbi:Protein STICHEL-like 3 [Abeliophyllum distichum]|uniref:Protein STICHEL-like 3 n=1 Tax=Abeliophyllum distichum TaxID=126358 RepID=A0ABD1QG25_9LAMI